MNVFHDAKNGAFAPVRSVRETSHSINDGVSIKNEIMRGEVHENFENNAWVILRQFRGSLGCTGKSGVSGVMVSNDYLGVNIGAIKVLE
jgi:hypothetical protein